jgi:predicted phosphodiesterase
MHLQCEEKYMWAVLSDIHGNLEALDAVLADIAKHPVSSIYCLGDIVGYGPNPIECLEKAMNWNVVLLGNHDNAAIGDPVHFSEYPKRAIHWTQSVLESNSRDDLWEYLDNRPRLHREREFVFVHGSPRNPVNEYVFPEDIECDPESNIAPRDRRYSPSSPRCNVPGIFTESLQFIRPEDVNSSYILNGRKALVNVGSVGQPRDGNWRTCYALVAGTDITFRRVEYDIERTIAKIYDTPELADFSGDRLREGQ